MTDNTVKIRLLDGGKMPKYGSLQAAGADICACLANGPVVLAPGEFKAVPCGFCLELPAGFEAQIRPRSGLALKNGITVLNSPGTVDSDYRGEIKAVLINHSSVPFTINNGDRIAQMVIARHETVVFDVVESLDGTDRGSCGFGSTGIK